MTTENQEPTQENTPEVPEIEVQAREMGWKPKEEYEGDPSKWVSAEIYVARAPLYEELERRGKEMKRYRQDLEAVKQQYVKMEEAAYQRALNALKQERKEALINEDVQKVLELDDKIEELREAKPVQQPNIQEIQQLTQEWLTQNEWYEKDPNLREYADGVGHALAGRGLDPVSVLEQVSAKVRQMFPEKFQKKVTVLKVENAPSGNKPKPVDKFELTEDEKKAMRAFARMGISEEQYIEDLKKVRG
ncbi:hypothetical protein [Microcystis sp. M42BS1]|uniref:hypothetical protein n=1 Tax=Microcystis sp. M42BS1 TaxID=2771192 RepID=UPI0025871C20|nr:hypothetical protein [Microcystis sp. M42BS1]MCA2570693.1 hypothetical protein [Microcystis sp. M42BS1]